MKPLTALLFGGAPLAPAGFETYDLTDPRALVLIRHELRDREEARRLARKRAHARRKARREMFSRFFRKEK